MDLHVAIAFSLFVGTCRLECLLGCSVGDEECVKTTNCRSRTSSTIYSYSSLSG